MAPDAYFVDPSRIPWPLPPASIPFKHPGYGEPANTLISFPRVDRTPDGRVGVHHATALLACQIIANNAFDGKLYHDVNATRPVTTAHDGILVAEAYYFHACASAAPSLRSVAADVHAEPPSGHHVPALPAIIPSLAPRYPIVPRFSDWQFPHSTFSRLAWPLPTMRDTRLPVAAGWGTPCAVTGASWALNSAHLVPKSEAAWFARNGMGEVAWGADVSAPGNILPLRGDVHYEMDERAFAVVPKIRPSTASVFNTTRHEPVADEEDAQPQAEPRDLGAGHNPAAAAAAANCPEPEYVVHVLGDWNPATAQLTTLYHNRPIRCPPQLSAQCLLARFAWTVFQRVKPFLLAGRPRTVLRLEDDAPVTEEMEAKALLDRYGGGGSRSTSPLKRSREPSAVSTRKRVAGQGQASRDQGEQEDEEWEDEPRRLVIQKKRSWEEWARELEDERDEQTRGRLRKRVRHEAGSRPLTPEPDKGNL